MKKIEENLLNSQKVYAELQKAMVDPDSSRYFVNFSDEIYDKLATIRLICDYIYTKFGKYEFRRDCIVDFKACELENLLEALESFTNDYQNFLKEYKKPSSRNISKIETA